VTIPFLPFTRPAIDEATIAAVGEVLRSGWITSGPKVKEFEGRLSVLCGGRPVRAVSSATGAMEIAHLPAWGRGTRSSPRRYPGYYR
jgi:dTDP-4-amino-4,6-dideoxygalactose transaminase